MRTGWWADRERYRLLCRLPRGRDRAPAQPEGIRRDAQGDSFPYTVDVAYTDAGGAEQIETLPDVENLTGSAHNDILAGDRRDNAIDGGAGNDTLYGGPGGGDDVMAGGLGNDRIFGGQGDDTLTGGQGDDSLAGGPGADVFVFGPGDGTDTVTDFSSGTDKLDLTAFEIESVEEIAMNTTDDGVTVDLTHVDGGTLLLAGLTTLPDAGDFWFEQLYFKHDCKR